MLQAWVDPTTYNRNYYTYPGGSVDVFLRGLELRINKPEEGWRFAGDDVTLPHDALVWVHKCLVALVDECPGIDPLLAVQTIREVYDEI